jgi:5-amino-6-(5-phosphoribosylamino)uracil reductase
MFCLPLSMSQFPDARPQTVAVLAMSADGKIADRERSHPTFGSPHDFDHLERQVALADAVLFGATTLKAGGTAMRVLKPELITQRQRAGRPEQPIQIVCTRTGDLDPNLPFFHQPIPRYLVTTTQGAQRWEGQSEFDQVLAPANAQSQIEWLPVFMGLHQVGIQRIVVLGGAEIIAALLEADLLDELHLTICPLLLGSKDAPTPVAGVGFLQDQAPRLKLLDVQQIENELFLHYHVLHRSQDIAV